MLNLGLHCSCAGVKGHAHVHAEECGVEHFWTLLQVEGDNDKGKNDFLKRADSPGGVIAKQAQAWG